MKKKIIIAGFLLTLGVAALVAAGLVLAHPFWDSDGDVTYPHIWGWNQNFTRPHWGYNGTYQSPWGNGTMPYSDGDEYYCPGPYWMDPESSEIAPYSPPDGVPRRDYGCGGLGGMMGRGGLQRRALSGWSG